MDALFNMIKMVKKLNSDKILKSIIVKNKSFLLDLNREQMYEYGILDINSPNRTVEYSNYTKTAKTGGVKGIKKAKYPRIDHITLKWDGTFHKSLKLKIQDDWYEIWSNDPTWVYDLSTQRDFENALGLTQKSIEKLRVFVLPLFITKTKELING